MSRRVSKIIFKNHVEWKTLSPLVVADTTLSAAIRCSYHTYEWASRYFAKIACHLRRHEENKSTTRKHIGNKQFPGFDATFKSIFMTLRVQSRHQKWHASGDVRQFTSNCNEETVFPPWQYALKRLTLVWWKWCYVCSVHVCANHIDNYMNARHLIGKYCR